MRDLSDFKWYRHKISHRRYLATYVTDKNAEKVGKRSKLWEMFGHALCLGVMSLASPDQWVVIKVDQRNNQLMNLNTCPKWTFERDYELLKKQDYLNPKVEADK